MYAFLLLLVEMIALYILSRRLNQSLFSLFYFITHSQQFAVAMTTIILFPGTVIHELSHLFSAEIMGVHTGKLTLIPERIDEGHIQAGSVEVAKTDPFRRTLIGLAPIFVGIVTVTLLSVQLTSLFPIVYSLVVSHTSLPGDTNVNLSVILFIVYAYLLFAVSNNMFSSKEDMQGVPPVIILVGLIIGAMYVVGLRVQLTGQVLQTMITVLQTLTTNLAVVLGINILLLIVITIFLRLVRPRMRS